MKLKDRLALAEQRIKDADAVIAYYGNTHTWGQYPYAKIPMFNAFNLVNQEDIEILQPFLKEPAKAFAGKKAREYQKKYNNQVAG